MIHIFHQPAINKVEMREQLRFKRYVHVNHLSTVSRSVASGRSRGVASRECERHLIIRVATIEPEAGFQRQ